MKEYLQEMTLWQHLDELRKRLFYILIGLVLGVIVSAIFADTLMMLVAKPIGGMENLLSIQVTENMSVYFQITLLSGFILSLPFSLFQLYRFVAPGLKENERRWVLYAVPLAFLLFIGGVTFGFLVMLPAAIPFLVEFPGPQVLPKWKDYVSFVTNLLFWVGLSFETPLLMYLLAKLGIVDAQGLAKQWRVAIILIAVIAAVATPTTDPVNMALLMVPLFILYLLGILLALLAGKKRNRSENVR
ncbi:MAG: twin-arginine translocase subunit TatC [Brevefilum sp.]|jgi:sec-independent protein translocase protein TatC